MSTMTPRRVLVLGGTSETAPLVAALVEGGYEALVSLATDLPLDLGSAAARRLSGRLDATQLCGVLQKEAVGALIDATHPYAAAAHATAWEAARMAGVPCVALERPGGIAPAPDVRFAAAHEEAAALLATFARGFLLTTGSRNLHPYVAVARDHNLVLCARVLPHPESLRACTEAGLTPAEIIAERGPFTVEQTQSLLREHGLGVLVTKDSGEGGGVGEKLQAARAEGCRIVVGQRPPRPDCPTVTTVAAVLETLSRWQGWPDPNDPNDGDEGISEGTATQDSQY